MKEAERIKLPRAMIVTFWKRSLASQKKSRCTRRLAKQLTLSVRVRRVALGARPGVPEVVPGRHPERVRGEGLQPADVEPRQVGGRLQGPTPRTG